MAQEINERDKPFWLAILLTGCFMATLIIALVVMEDSSLAKEVVAWFTPWLTMAYTWYFSEKTKNHS